MQTPSNVRLKLTIHYDGTGFHGWQIQPDARTVQGEIEAAIHRLGVAEPRIIGSGRTDAGVHATGQVASLTLPGRWTADTFQRAVNAHLPNDVWVEAAEQVDLAFHPRYDAIARTYHYFVGTSAIAFSPLHRRRCWPHDETVDFDALAHSAEAFVGTHAFAAFAKSGQPERGVECTVTHSEWTPWKDLGVRYTVTADRYLHHMVRYMVGTMVYVATGHRPVEDVRKLLGLGALWTADEGLPRRSGSDVTSPPAPAQGLFLAAVEYPSSSETRSRPSLRTSPPPQPHSTDAHFPGYCGPRRDPPRR